MNHRRPRTGTRPNQTNQRPNNNHSSNNTSNGKQRTSARGSRTNAQKLRHYEQSVEKHQNLAKEQLMSDDRVGAEYHFQYADHFYRCFKYIESLMLEIERNSPHEQNEKDNIAEDTNNGVLPIIT